jgi:two-component system, NtrC family, sensor kinase
MPESYALYQIGLLYFESNDYDHALEYYEQSLDVRRKLGDKWGEAGSLDNIGFIHFKKGNYDPAKDFCSKALSISKSIGDKKGQSNSLFRLANIYKELREYERASEYCEDSLQLRREIGDKKGESEILLFLAALSVSETHINKPLELLTAAMKLARELNAVDLLSRIHFGFYKFYKQDGQHEKALSYLEDHINFEKELHTESVKQKMINLETSQVAEASRREAENYRIRNIELDKLYAESKKQKEEIEVQKKNAEQALAELKATQAQLVQSEKMASLGQLTAGIAHEIQNPLNFVNNFSEVNLELIEELMMERHKAQGTRNEEIENEILNNIQANEEKINHHGKRADAIVKGMLQHSRTTTGQKVLTDINALADEYLRLSYHGLRAKEKTFNATIRTEFDNSIGKINIIPQDIGRVILNLINNAFYAVNEKEKLQAAGYKPQVVVSTKKLNDKVEISVKDNGSGIPGSIKEKIFQPFFTTKPTGQGTGLGLSLAYDIIKAHGGETVVDSKEGEGTVFVVQLPVNNSR